MRLSFSQFLFLLILALLASGLLAFSGLDLGELIEGSAPPRSQDQSNSNNPIFDFPVTWVTVDAVLDGDTIRLTNGKRVRYIGIDTPESETDPAECFALKATKRNRKLVDGKRVALRKDRSETDRYGRLLRYVYLEDGRMVNEILLEEGFAIAAEFRPDTLFAAHFAAVESEAKTGSIGLWGACQRQL